MFFAANGIETNADFKSLIWLSTQPHYDGSDHDNIACLKMGECFLKLPNSEVSAPEHLWDLCISKSIIKDKKLISIFC